MYRTKENRERKNHIHLYLSDKERLILEKKFEASGFWNMSDFLRRMIVFGDVIIPDFSDVREMNYLLGKIGSNINQIARKVNTFGAVDRTDIDAIKESMEEIWRTQKKILSILMSASNSLSL